MSTPATSLRSDSPLGKRPTTRVRFFDLAVAVLAGVGCLHVFPVGFGEGEDGEAFG